MKRIILLILLTAIASPISAKDYGAMTVKGAFESDSTAQFDGAVTINAAVDASTVNIAAQEVKAEGFVDKFGNPGESGLVVGTEDQPYIKADGSEADAKLPYFFDLSANVSFPVEIGGTQIKLRLDLNNITNRAENYYRASYSADYGRNDALGGQNHWYVLQAPMFNAFLTTEVYF